jgi:2-keto-4-pentenoate hydratase
MPALELVDDRYEEYGDFGVYSLIADDFFNAGCVLGRRRIRAWHKLDLAAVKGTMWINGHEIGTGVGADIMGHPFEALAWIANNRAARGRALEANSFVLLGSVVQTQWLQAGDRVRIAIDGLGGVSLDVD